ncbi:MAG: single-stranded DNA-binding protein [Bacteroidota bacterium]
MSNNVNKVILVGHVGKNPEVKSFENGGKLVQVSLATKETWKDAAGAKQEQTEWHQVVVRKGSGVNYMEQFVKKGMLLYVEGRLKSKSYKSKSGEEKSVTEIVADEVSILQSSKKSEEVTAA